MRAPILLTLVFQLHAQDLPLRAGIAKADLTPAGSMPMYGYSNRRCGPATGTHDPLHAKALVLAAGDSKMAIVTLDLGSFVSEKLAAGIKTKLGIPVVLLAASHTHSGPAFLPPTSAQPAYLAEIESKIFDAVKQASDSLFPARLAISKGSLQLGYNRLVPREDGRSRAMFENPERIPLGPVDPEFVNLHITDASGATKALLVHYAVHAVVLGPTNCLYSADFPGALQAKVESEMSGVQCMFVQGGAGDINPLAMARSGNTEADFSVVQKVGEALAASVLRAAKSPTMLGPVKHPIEAKSDLIRYPQRWDKSQSLEVGITTVLINREIAIAATPGELMHKLQLEWKRRAEVPYPLFYGYTYSSGGTWPGYIPDLQSSAHGGYGADANTRIAIGAGEDILQRHLIHLYSLLGMWRDQPGRN